MNIARVDIGAHAGLLDRAEAGETIAQHFPELPAALSSLADYGSHLIPRCLQSSEKRLPDLIAVGVLARQALVMLDASQVLFQEGAVQAALLQLRALFEVSIYLDWMLKQDTMERATAYYTWNLRRNRQWILRATTGSREAIALESDMSGLDFGQRLRTSAVQSEMARQLSEVNTILNSAKYARMDQRFEARRGKRAFDVEWYAVVLPKNPKPSLASLSKDVGRTAEYRLIYELGSEAMHSARSDVHIRVRDGKARLRPLRDLTDIGLVGQLLIGQGIHVFLALLTKYRPAEKPNFANKYIAEWQAALTRSISVKYEEPE